MNPALKTCLIFFLGAMVAQSVSVAATVFPAAKDLPAQKLPDPLVMFNGQPVRTEKDWRTKRRPELKELFQYYEYGYFRSPAKIKSKIDYVDKDFFGGKATLKLVTISFSKKDAPKMHLMVVIPNSRKNPAPVFLGINFSGNHSLVNDTNVPLPDGWMGSKYAGAGKDRATSEGRGKQVDAWAIEQSIERGYAVATFFGGEIQPDVTNATTGLRTVFHGSKDSMHDWGTIAAWAWGVERAVDYLEKDKDIDGKKIAVVGHSRLGKAAMLAGAFDERIAMTIPLQAGCGGTAPSRGKIGESVKAINTHFPHWFCDEFKEFNDQPERLPFDQNCLIAMCAPRPVLISCATEDTWSNPEGQFEMLVSASPVYRLLGADGIASAKMPEVGQLMDSTLGYYIRPGKHSMTKVDWAAFLDFADKHFGKPDQQ